MTGPPEISGVCHFAGGPGGVVVDASVGGTVVVRSNAAVSTGDIVVAADLRLDDRDSLMDALGVPAWDRAVLADGELLLRAWLKWGQACAGRLLGDFAFAIWDGATRTLFCARDHIGARPFYYSRTATGLHFASDVRTLLADAAVDDTLDEAYVGAALGRAAFASNGRTWHRAIRRLPPGHGLTVTAEGCRLTRFWSPADAPDLSHRRDGDYAAQLLELLERAVRDRLRGAARPGVHVSGGLDSSAVAALAARILRADHKDPPCGLSWVPEPGESGPRPEFDGVRAVAAHAGIAVVHAAPTAESVADVLRRDSTREMISTGTLLNEVPVQRAAADRGVDVILSGWGGDEGASFNGRGYLPGLLLSGRWRQLLRACRGRGRHPLGVALREAAVPLLPGNVRARLRGDGRPDGATGFLDAAFAAGVVPLALPAYRETDSRRVREWLLTSGLLTARIEEWAAAGLRHGIAYRYPMLDRRVLEFTLGLPPHLFRHDGQRRWIFRQALARILPAEAWANAGKRDPERFAAMDRTFRAALPAVRETLDRRPPHPDRARFIDMRRLRDALEPAAYDLNPRPLRLMRAVHFLGLG